MKKKNHDFNKNSILVYDRIFFFLNWFIWRNTLIKTWKLYLRAIFRVVTFPQVTKESVKESEGLGVQIATIAPNGSHYECGLDPWSEERRDIVVVRESILEDKRAIVYRIIIESLDMEGAYDFMVGVHTVHSPPWDIYSLKKTKLIIPLE